MASESQNLPLDTVLTGDCLEVLPALPEGSIDLIFADPPYNLQLRNELWRPNRTKVDAVDDSWDQFASFEEYDHFTRAWLSECRRVLKDRGTLWVIGSYHNIHRVGTILQDLGYWILNEVVWIKLNPMPNFRGVRFTNAHETLIWVQKNKGAPYTFNHHQMKAANDGLQMRSDWLLPLCTGKERIKINGEKAHTTQKPEALLKRVIASSSKPGDIVLDPFFGTGTTGAVARKLGRHWIGIERDQTYVEVARERINAIVPIPPEERDEPANPRSRRERRIPFVVLVEAGLLHSGQTLFGGEDSAIQATVLTGGKIQCQEHTGSIHQVARALVEAPCNGWEYWKYRNETGELLPIDALRRKIAG